MASSRKSKPSSPGRALQDTVARALRDSVTGGDSLLLGLSGGVDSVVLLHLLAGLRARMDFDLRALHVNHQLSPHADAWAAHCRRLCRAAGVPLRVVKVTVARGNSLEAAARAERQRALFAARVDHVLLAHNLDDQAETLLLRLLRGAGVKGLAAMRPASMIGGRHVLRPLLGVPRSEIVAYAVAHELVWVEDESNGIPDFLRNYLRLELCPLIERRVPAYRTTLARAAANAGDAALLLDELASIDRQDDSGPGITLKRLRELSLPRARNLVRHYLGASGVDIPAADRLDEALRQARSVGTDSRLRIRFGDRDLRVYRGRLHLVPTAASAAEHQASVAWRGERKLTLAAGVLDMKPVRGAGLSRARLAEHPVTVRPRTGGERLQPGPGRPLRTLKNLLQEAGIPPWERADLPCVYWGDRLVCVPGVAMDSTLRAGSDEPGILPVWVRASLRP